MMIIFYNLYESYFIKYNEYLCTSSSSSSFDVDLDVWRKLFESIWLLRMFADFDGSLDAKFLFFTLDGLTNSWLFKPASIWTVSEDDTRREDDIASSSFPWFVGLYDSFDFIAPEPDSLSIFLPNSRLLVSKYFNPNPFWLAPGKENNLLSRLIYRTLLFV